MPNLLKEQYLDVKKHLLDCAKILETKPGNTGYYLDRAHLLKEKVRGFSDGLTGLLDNCYRYYRANNRGRELMAEAGKAASTAKGYYRTIEDFEREPDFKNLHLGEYAHAKTIMFGIVQALEDYRDHGMTVHHNFFT